MKVNSTSTGNSSTVSNTSLSGGSGSGSGHWSSPVNVTTGISEDVSPTYPGDTPESSDETEFYDVKNISIHLPPALFENVTDTSVGVLFTFYTGPALFPVRRAYDEDFPEVISPVIGASLAGLDPPVNLTTNVTITLPFSKVRVITCPSTCPILLNFSSLQLLKESNILSLNTAVVCVSWNFSAAGM